MNGFRAARLLARAALWGVAALLAALITWIAWVIAMSGGGLTLVVAALFLAAPWPLFHLATLRRTRPSDTGGSNSG